MTEATPAEIFAALKLIEQLYKDGHIPQHVFKNILYEHSDVVDITQFSLQREDKQRKNNAN
jgi:hypothetical protein